ncbi:MAG: ATP-binding protein [Phycisphaeraceae bacterium JB051]
MSDMMSQTTSQHVLVLDENQATGQSTSQLLKQHGFVVTTVAESQEALQVLQFDPPLLLIMGHCDKTEQTLQTLEQVKSISPQVQIILHTCECSVAIAQKALNLQVFALVEKSQDAEHLLDTVHRAIHQYDALALQRSEMRFATIVNDLNDMVLRYLPDGTITFANRVFMDLFALSAIQLKGKQIFEFIHPKQLVNLKQLLKQFTPHNTVHTMDVKLHLPSKREAWYRWTNRAIYDNHDRIQEIQSTLHDITDTIYSERYLLSRVTQSNNQLDETHKRLSVEIASHRKAQSQLRQHEAELAHVARLNIMGEMASSIAHELNQPLAAIANYTRGCIKRLERVKDLPPAILQAMEGAARQSDRAGQILRRLRDLIQKRPTQKQQLAMESIFDEVRQFILPLLQNHGMKLNVRNELTQQIVNVDSIQIQQVFINLIRNAIEAMTPVKPEHNLITVHLHQKDKDTLTAEVIDQGRGLEDKNPAELFDMFVSTNPQGMGIGLAICRTIIESHGGRCHAANHPEGGAVFSFTLPISADEDDASNQAITAMSL